MVSIQQVKDELAARCKRISGLRCYANMPPVPQPPALCVHGPAKWAYDDTFDGGWQLHFQLWLYVDPTDPVRAAQALDAYVSPEGAKSIRLALYGEEVTPEVIETLRVIGGTQAYGIVTFEAGPSFYGVPLEVEVRPAV